MQKFHICLLATSLFTASLAARADVAAAQPNRQPVNTAASCVSDDRYADDYGLLAQMGYTSEQACEFVAAGGDQELAQQYKAAGFNIGDAITWAQGGFMSVSHGPNAPEARAWRSAGYTPAEAMGLRDHYPAQTVLTLLAAGFTKQEVVQWSPYGTTAGLMENSADIDATRLAQDMIAWKKIGADPEQATELMGDGLDPASMGYVAQDCGKQLGIQANLFHAPEHSKGYCYVLEGKVEQLLDGGTVLASPHMSLGETLYHSTHDDTDAYATRGLARVAFGSSTTVPAKGALFRILVKSDGSFAYVDAAGKQQTLPTVTVLYRMADPSPDSDD